MRVAFIFAFSDIQLRSGDLDLYYSERSLPKKFRFCFVCFSPQSARLGTAGVRL
jgi:hypothetical protein